MSVYNIREKFSYTIATSSIDYVRYYNFNTTTVSSIPIQMTNSDEEIPITVYISATKPWIQIVDPTTGADLKNPNGNVVLGPTSSSVALIKIDLPPEVESEPTSVLYPNIILDIKSGSFPIIPQNNNNSSKRNVIIPENDIYFLGVGESVEVNITVYDSEGNQDLSAEVDWRSNNRNIVRVEEPENTQANYNPYTPRNVIGVSSGETTVTISAGENRTTTVIFRVRPTATETTTQPPSDVPTDDTSRTDSSPRNDGPDGSTLS
jgi:hypothetical protein